MRAEADPSACFSERAELVEFVATVIILTCTYALLAAGIVILYKAGRVVNFAHGEIAIVGGYVFYSSGLMAGGSPWFAIRRRDCVLDCHGRASFTRR